MNSLDKQYLDLINNILENGVVKSDRTGTGTKSIFGYTIRHKMSEGFPILTSKKMPFKSILTELLWFIKGRSDLRYLLENNCTIWVGDAYKRYCNSHTVKGNSSAKNFIDRLDSVKPIMFNKEGFINEILTNDDFNEKWGDLGKIYGVQWRNWSSRIHTPTESNKNLYSETSTDQLVNLINDLKHNPDSRRLIVNAWNVTDLNDMILPPCHMMFQCYTRELTLEERNKYYTSHYLGLDTTEDNLNAMNIPKRAISLQWYQRSVDTPLGLPFNIASYGILLELLGKIVNMVPDELIGTLGDTHIYLNQIDDIKKQFNNKTYDLPKLNINLSDLKNKRVSELLNTLSTDNFNLIGYNSSDKIKIKLSN